MIHWPCPCIFNSGTVIHNFGATGIEISGGNISLIAWYDTRNPRSRIFHYEKNRGPLPGDALGYGKPLLKKDSLHYIFTRIALLTGRREESLQGKAERIVKALQNSSF